MKRLLIIVMGLVVCMPAWSALKVFSCEPEWSSLLKELGKDQLTIYTATTAMQDPHHIQARPSLIAKMRRADLLVCTGAGLETGWLPVLLRRAANPKVQPGQAGHFKASHFVTLLDKPEQIDRAHGDIHAEGDPHIHTDPANILRIAKALSERLVKLDPENAQSYQHNLEDFIQRWQHAMQGWQLRADKLKGMAIVSQHKSWTYLINWIGLDEVARLEAKPGVPPSTAHLTKVLALLKQQPAQAVIRAAYQSPKASAWLHKKTGIPILIMPYTVGGNKQAKDLFGLFDATLLALESASHE